MHAAPRDPPCWTSTGLRDLTEAEVAHVTKLEAKNTQVGAAAWCCGEAVVTALSSSRAVTAWNTHGHQPACADRSLQGIYKT